MLFMYERNPNNVCDLIASINTSKSSVLCYTHKRIKHYQINVFDDGHFYDFINSETQKLFKLEHINKGKAIAPHLNTTILKWRTNNSSISDIIMQTMAKNVSQAAAANILNNINELIYR
jgi:hypothetical protein